MKRHFAVTFFSLNTILFHVESFVQTSGRTLEGQPDSLYLFMFTDCNADVYGGDATVVYFTQRRRRKWVFFWVGPYKSGRIILSQKKKE
ncbi:hypothetical protein JOB18_023572 [Solea senegalensis]|uniref:Secreted protein n=1 Tax=Solea senegalensis TaxID=28829 RepID=A0AAV6R6A0_SOLSE|nr:hypothetical protein JOB18_023572 [Solea senegalensis]